MCYKKWAEVTSDPVRSNKTLPVKQCVRSGFTNGTIGIPISFKVLPMVPLVIPFAPMVMQMVPLAFPMVAMVPVVSLVKLPLVPLEEPRTEPV